ncbi:30S ribosomal protein S13, partial [archaeon]
MARIAGRDLPPNKRIEIALTYIYGIGLSRSRKILEATGVDPDKRVKDLTEKEIELLRKEIEGKYKVEGALRAEV